MTIARPHGTLVAAAPWRSSISAADRPRLGIGGGVACASHNRPRRRVPTARWRWTSTTVVVSSASAVDLLTIEDDASDEAMRALVPRAWREDAQATGDDGPTRVRARPTTTKLIDIDGDARPFRMSSRSRLTPTDARRFPGDDTFAVVARAVCDADVLPRKELFETWAAATVITDAFFTEQSRLGLDSGDGRTNATGTRVLDLAGGHGFLALCLLILNSRLRSAVVVDRRKPDSHERLVSALVTSLGPEHRLHARVRFVEASILDASPDENTLLVSVHACGGLSDVILNFAANAGAPVAVVPCCHSGLFSARQLARRLDGANPAEGSVPMDPSTAMDVARLELLRRAGHDVDARLIPRTITPKNRVILGAAPRRKSEYSGEKSDDGGGPASPGWPSVADAIPASPWKRFATVIP